jgi:hypothetical protein
LFSIPDMKFSQPLRFFKLRYASGRSNHVEIRAAGNLLPRPRLSFDLVKLGQNRVDGVWTDDQSVWRRLRSGDLQNNSGRLARVATLRIAVGRKELIPGLVLRQIVGN